MGTWRLYLAVLDSTRVIRKGQCVIRSSDGGCDFRELGLEGLTLRYKRILAKRQ